ncbi:MAG: Menaquinone biosynthesis methyltransferase related protein [uncultured bacterium]|nr:MAG: Menaquinone biosynthesis methyltransferase related protein [uncultured bacterium]
MNHIAGIEATESYFIDNAKSWIFDAYENKDYIYPIGLHRVRIVLKIIRELVDIHKILDIGCGGGHLCCELAQNGYNVLGIDQSRVMIEEAEKNRLGLSQHAKDRLNFQFNSLNDIQVDTFDVLTALGLIGYLPNDEQLFKKANMLLRNNGYLIVSFRNRLFNLFSISHRTLNEIKAGEFIGLVEEASSLYEKIDNKDVKSFIEELHTVTKKILDNGLLDKKTNTESFEKTRKNYTGAIEARQTSPKQAMKIANNCGFNTVKLYGIHPHIMLAGLNEMFPLQVYNQLSDSLIPLEESRMCLLWSSVFIGIFQKNN